MGDPKEFRTELRGECDECHRDGVDLCTLPEHVEDGGDWAYCKRCWERGVKEYLRKVDEMNWLVDYFGNRG